MDEMLVGSWSANMYENLMGGPAEEYLKFRPDGWGWYEIVNYFPEAAQVFEWQISQLGRLSMRGRYQLFLGEGNQVEQSQSLFRFESVAFEVRMMSNVADREMEVLYLSLGPRESWVFPQFVPERYGRTARIITVEDEPDFSPWQRLAQSSPEDDDELERLLGD